ncbi:hypothetical protein QF018_005843, partial [Pseudomonas laurylsulfatiphila]
TPLCLAGRPAGAGGGGGGGGPPPPPPPPPPGSYKMGENQL